MINCLRRCIDQGHASFTVATYRNIFATSVRVDESGATEPSDNHSGWGIFPDTEEG